MLNFGEFSLGKWKIFKNKWGFKSESMRSLGFIKVVLKTTENKFQGKKY